MLLFSSLLRELQKHKIAMSNKDKTPHLCHDNLLMYPCLFVVKSKLEILTFRGAQVNLFVS